LGTTITRADVLYEPKECKHGTDGADEDPNICSACCAEMRAAVEELTGVEQVIANDLGLPKEILFPGTKRIGDQVVFQPYPQHIDCRCIRDGSLARLDVAYDSEQQPQQFGSRLQQLFKPSIQHVDCRNIESGATREMVAHAINYAIAEGQFIGVFTGEKDARIALRWAVEARSQIMERGLPLRASVDGPMITITSVTLPPITYAATDSET
jgi:hypothetical protein